MTLNISSSLTPEQIILEAHQQIAIPSLILAWIGFMIILLVVGLFLINPRKGSNPYGKFMWIWVITSAISGMFILFLTQAPLFIQSIKEFFINIIPNF